MEYKCNEDEYPHELQVKGKDIMSSTGCNVMNEESLEYHRQFDASEFATILGYSSVIDEDDIGSRNIIGDEYTEEDVGNFVFKVVRGHHRATVAAEQGLYLSCCKV